MHRIWQRAGRCVPAGEPMERSELVACALKECTPLFFSPQGLPMICIVQILLGVAKRMSKEYLNIVCS